MIVLLSWLQFSKDFLGLLLLQLQIVSLLLLVDEDSFHSCFLSFFLNVVMPLILLWTEFLPAPFCLDFWIIPTSRGKKNALRPYNIKVCCLYMGSLFCEDEGRLHSAWGHVEVAGEIPLCFGVTLDNALAELWCEKLRLLLWAGSPCQRSSVLGFQKGTGQIRWKQHTKFLSLGSFLVLVTRFHSRKIRSFG